MRHFLGLIPFCKVVIFDVMEHFHLEEVLVKILGGIKHLWKSVKKFFWRSSFLTNTYYHNSIYMSIAKKKIVGFPTIYFFDSISLISSSSDLSERKSGAENGP